MKTHPGESSLAWCAASFQRFKRPIGQGRWAMAGEGQAQKRAAAEAYAFDEDSRWTDYWNNVLIPPSMTARPDVRRHFQLKFYQRFIVRAIPALRISFFFPLLQVAVVVVCFFFVIFFPRVWKINNENIGVLMMRLFEGTGFKWRRGLFRCFSISLGMRQIDYEVHLQIAVPVNFPRFNAVQFVLYWCSGWSHIAVLVRLRIVAKVWGFNKAQSSI